jgi:hypothetical protein
MALPVDVYLHSPYPDTSMENNTIAGFQFCVSPPRDPTNGADLITTSLGLVSSWLPRRAVFRQVEVNVEAAGLPHLIAAGNEGPTARSIRCPGDCPPPWPNPANHPSDRATSAVITVGATDNSDNAASFTSIGPTDWGSVAPYNDYAYPPGLMDPDVCMPGVNILSTYNSGDQSYQTMSGTSMATPGAAGVVALMLSKNPFASPRLIDSILEMHSVRDLGPSGKDVTYGAGRINCSLAVAFTPPPNGLRMMRYVVDDAPPGGNGDGAVNPGETVNLPTWIINRNAYTSQGVKGYFRKTVADPNVTLIDTFHHFGSVAAGDSAYTGASGYKFSVAVGCTNGYPLPLVLAVKDTTDSMWVNPYGLAVGTGALVNDQVVVHDPPPGGNGNGKIDPNETADLEIAVRNIGRSSVSGVTAILRSMDSRFTVQDSVGTYGDIPADTAIFNTADQYHVTADATIPREFYIPCSLRIVGNGYAATRYFEIQCGVLTETDPIPDGPRTPALYLAYDDVDVSYTEHPTYNWIETRGRGTQLTLSDDQTVQVTLPPEFGTFRYYGQDYTQISVCGNGFVMPGNYTIATWTNAELPTSSMTAPLLCASWDDLYPPTGGGVWYYYDATNHAFVIEWDSVAYYSPRTTFDKFQIVLYDSTVNAYTGDNEFAYQYMTADGYTSNTVGEQNETYDIGINALYNTAYHRACAPLAPGRAIKFTTDTMAYITGIGQGSDRVGLNRYALFAGRNPFRSAGVVRFILPRPMAARLAVYDIAGREVRELLNSGSEPLDAGAHAVSWNGQDGTGRTAARGVYFYRLQTELGTLARKVVKVE